jgi:hypothetical protein
MVPFPLQGEKGEVKKKFFLDKKQPLLLQARSLFFGEEYCQWQQTDSIHGDSTISSGGGICPWVEVCLFFVLQAVGSL